MEIDWIESRKNKHVLSWFILQVMSKTGIDKFGDFDSSRLKITIQINDIEVDFLDAFECLQSQLSDIENNGVKKGVEQAAYKMQDFITKMLEEGGEL